ncbi:MAG TPA: T9SS type A sorting domain-containing protein, partial [Flavobacteriales bacterium]|nr:T9SS type A sorting domain-containing protein [Flavobacteriales bacterium]
DGSATLEVTDASGRTVLPARWSTGTSSISTTPLANGPYVLRCTTKGTTHMVRFIVRHTH